MDPAWAAHRHSCGGGRGGRPMGTTPEELRLDMEHRRAHLSRNVDRLADRLMGTAQEAAHGTSAGLHGRRQRYGTGQGDRRRRAAGRPASRGPGAAAYAGPSARGRPDGFRRGDACSCPPASPEIEEQAGRHLCEHSDELLEPVKQTPRHAAPRNRTRVAAGAARDKTAMTRTPPVFR
ncbi:DUF3618 domain-containing protein [Streptomyces virginiae]|uniref:DUF3618 domain-containing protein n=1 Tax=Streptomyces virginiae TaxID=1961 RepID=UPI00362E4C23